MINAKNGVFKYFFLERFGVLMIWSNVTGRAQEDGGSDTSSGRLRSRSVGRADAMQEGRRYQYK